MNSKTKFLIKCLSKLFSLERRRCPSCGSGQSVLVSRRRIILELRRCSDCSLLFRAPTTTSEENERFYQKEYTRGITTDIPDKKKLEYLKSTKFQRSEKNFYRYIQVLSALGAHKDSRILDFGCSWGYGSWQMKEFGFDVTSFEISKPRCKYAREKLGLKAYDCLDNIKEDKFDFFFSSHVMEHVPSVAQTFEFAKSKLKKGGIILTFTPNGSLECRQCHPKAWELFWGMVHPNFLDDQFYRKNFSDIILASSNFKDSYDLKHLDWHSELLPDLSDIELLAAVRI